VDRPRIAVMSSSRSPPCGRRGLFAQSLNNCYDEAVINANFGLGESVVAGQVSPDQFVVDKVARAILERRTGKKETSVWLVPEGGIHREPSAARDQLCLSDEQVLQLTDIITRVENDYGQPMDIEWAYADDTLYLLQARPSPPMCRCRKRCARLPARPSSCTWT